MELKKRNKVIEIGGQKYQLNKLDARTGSYVAFKLGALLTPVLTGGNVTESELASGIAALSRDDFDELLTVLLSVVLKVNNADGLDVPEPIINAGGAFIDENLEYDTAAVLQLAGHAAFFNVSGFFNAAGLQKTEK